MGGGAGVAGGAAFAVFGGGFSLLHAKRNATETARRAIRERISAVCASLRCSAKNLAKVVASRAASRRRGGIVRLFGGSVGREFPGGVPFRREVKPPPWFRIFVITLKIGKENAVDLHHKHVLITGASRGIGEALALRFAAKGSRVSLVAVVIAVKRKERRICLPKRGTPFAALTNAPRAVIEWLLSDLPRR